MNSGGRTITGGCCLMRYPPLTFVANFPSEPRLVFLRALARFFCAALIVALSVVGARSANISSTSILAYQMSRKRIAAAAAIVLR